MSKSRLSELESKYAGEFGFFSIIDEAINAAKNSDKIKYEDFLNLRKKIIGLGHELIYDKKRGDDMVYLKNLYDICNEINNSYYCETSEYKQVDGWEKDLSSFRNEVSECGVFEIDGCKEKMDEILLGVENNFQKLADANNRLPGLLSNVVSRTSSLRTSFKNYKSQISEVSSTLAGIYNDRVELYNEYLNKIIPKLDDEAGEIKHDGLGVRWVATTTLCVGGEQAATFAGWWNYYVETGDMYVGQGDLLS